MIREEVVWQKNSREQNFRIFRFRILREYNLTARLNRFQKEEIFRSNFIHRSFSSPPIILCNQFDY